MIEITHIQAMGMRGLLIRAKNLLATVESADPDFIASRDAAIRDCQSSVEFLLKKMQETSPALTRHYSDSASGESHGS